MIIIGGPGTGKTQFLVSKVEELLKRHAPKEIAYVSFTNAAVDEAKARVMSLTGCKDEDVINFRTVHSMAFNALGARHNDMVQRKHLEEFSDIVSEDFHYHNIDNIGPIGETVGGDELMNIEQYSRAAQVDLRQAWKVCDCDVDYWRLARFAKAYELFKSMRGLIDFTDLLTKFVAEGGAIKVKHVIVDEAQDLTALQWACIWKAYKNAEVWIAGDDDQSIYRWSGSAADYFISLSQQETPYVLNTSHRLPFNIHRLAGKIISRVRHRIPKTYRVSATREDQGSVDWAVELSHTKGLESGEWLVLARTHHQLKQMERDIRELGYLYIKHGVSSVDHKELKAIQAWEDLRAGKLIDKEDAELALQAKGIGIDLDDGRWPAPQVSDIHLGNLTGFQEPWHKALTGIHPRQRQYYLAARKRGEKLLGAPRIRLDTIHGAKGQEAKNVILSTALTQKVRKAFELDPDSEHRVFYVGATRASERLVLIEAENGNGYEI